MTMTYQRPHPATLASSRAPSINLLAATALAFTIVAAFVGFGGDAAANVAPQPLSAQSTLSTDAIEVYIVEPGDTLWAIATQLARPGEDIRPIVDALTEQTGGAYLDVGQRIVIDHSTLRG